MGVGSTCMKMLQMNIHVSTTHSIAIYWMYILLVLCIYMYIYASWTLNRFDRLINHSIVYIFNVSYLLYLYVCIHVYMLCIYICIYIYIYICHLDIEQIWPVHVNVPVLPIVVLYIYLVLIFTFIIYLTIYTFIIYFFMFIIQYLMY